MKFTYDYDDSFILMHKDLSKELFLEKAGAGDGYSRQMFSNMYDSITSELINAREEYESYYSFEYPTLENFLYKKFNLEPNAINKLMKKMAKHSEYILYRKEEYSYGNYGIVQFAYSETLYKRIFKILLLKEKKHEN